MNNTAHYHISNLIDNIEKVIKGKRFQIELVITSLLAGGHILIEDNPGTGKTILARALAHSISNNTEHDSLIFKRIQFTPDLLPMDILGSFIYDESIKDFVFKKGPLFCNILLADEINRASPKVQSALLESMAEQQITMGDHTYQLYQLFFTIATQNPIDMEGTYPLPAAQLDRFFMKIQFGYVDENAELEIYKSYNEIKSNLDSLQQVMDKTTLLQLIEDAKKVFVHDEIIHSVSNLVRATREHVDIATGASTRSGIAFLKCLRAFALVNGRDFVTENDFYQLAYPVLHHRLVYKNKQAKASLFNKLIQSENDRLAKLKLY